MVIRTDQAPDERQLAITLLNFARDAIRLLSDGLRNRSAVDLNAECGAMQNKYARLRSDFILHSICVNLQLQLEEQAEDTTETESARAAAGATGGSGAVDL